MADRNHNKVEEKGKNTDNAVPAFDSKAYAKGIGSRWGGWGGIIGAVTAVTAVVFLGKRPTGVFTSIMSGIGKPFAIAGAMIGGAIGGGLVANVAGQIKGDRNANKFQQKYYETVAENQGLQRENAVLKDVLESQQHEKRFTDKIHSRGEHGSHAEAASRARETAEAEVAAR